MTRVSISNQLLVTFRSLVALAIILFAVVNGFAALSPNSSADVFTSLADHLLQQQLGMRLRDIKVAPTNQYDSAVHRIFQVTANIYDATTTNELPAVFRPLVEARSNGVFLAGFTNDHRVSTLGPWLQGNTNNLPLVIGAKKGLPNFNEFTLRSDIVVQRRLQVTKTDINPGTRPNGTNQMYILGVSNFFGVEAWNSYVVSKTGPYPRPLTVAVSNATTVSIWNSFGVLTNALFTSVATTNLAANEWRGDGLMGFILPLSTNRVFLNNAVYRLAENVFANTSFDAFETTPMGFPVPYWLYSISNRLTYLLSEPEGDDGRIVDFVILQDQNTVDLFRELVASANPYRGIAGVSAAIVNLWNTNRVSSNSPPVGILQQMDMALGNVQVPNSEWRAFGLSTTANETDKARAIDAFRIFCGLGPLTTNDIGTNDATAMVSPFNPAAKLSVLSSWQANDPLVHYHLDDLRLFGAATNHQYLKPSQPATNVPPSSLGRMNDRHSPWGGRADSSYEDPDAYSPALKDPGVFGSDDWSFPVGQAPSPAWLGRVHRGTPWQTIYLKSAAAPLGGPAGWTNQSPDLVRGPTGIWSSRTHPTNDWRMVEWLTQTWNTNDPRNLTSVNTTNAASWRACFNELTVLSNNLSFVVLGQAPQFETNVIAVSAPQLDTIVSGIERVRSAMSGGYFPGVAAFLSVPELSMASPWLNLTADQLKWGLTDEAYEMLPSQLLSRVRADPVGTASRSDNGVELHFTAFEGYAYRVEGSADLRTWETLSEPHYGAEGAFTLAVPPTSDWKFFRAVLLP